MAKSPLQTYADRPLNDPDSPELTEEDFLRMRPVSKETRAAFSKARGRPPKSLDERKKLVSIRLHPLVIEHFKAGGPGWQTRMEEALIDAAFAETARQEAERGQSGQTSKAISEDVGKSRQLNQSKPISIASLPGGYKMIVTIGTQLVEPKRASAARAAATGQFLPQAGTKRAAKKVTAKKGAVRTNAIKRKGSQ